MGGLRSRAREQAQEDQPDADEGGVSSEARAPSLEAIAIRTEMSACIRGFVERLPDNHKMVMLPGELEGFKNTEIAATLGVGLDAVKIRLHRARQKLRGDLKEGCGFYRDESRGLACDRKSA